MRFQGGWFWSLALGVLVSSIAHAGLLVHKLPGHVLPSSVTRGAKEVRLDNPQIPIVVRLRLRNLPDLDLLLERLYTPGDALYGKFIDPEEFASRFGATTDEVDPVVQYLQGLGCTVQNPYSAYRLQVDAVCAQATLERALGIKISHWVSPDHEPIQTIDTDPVVPEALAIAAIHGLTSVPRHTHYVKYDQSHGIPSGSGPTGGLGPSDIKTAYHLNSVAANGAGETLGLFELDGYLPTDVAAYESNFGISTAPPLSNVLVDGVNGAAGASSAEDTLDIELMSALAPAAKQILVYEGPNSDAGVIDVYQRIATDDLAREVSTSWGAPEGSSPPAILQTENQIFIQMAAQGQTIFAASGDSGAYDDGATLSVDDPGSQPFVASAGGTTLALNADHSYASETVWWNGSIGGGGGVSAVWPVPSWQMGLANAKNLGSSTQRNVPDVALNADPASGYAIFVGGQWGVYGGTSCSAPLWAAFGALANQRRAANGLGPLGFANLSLYTIGKSEQYAGDFHDLQDASTNGHFPAVPGYDLSTGWGSFQGGALLEDLSKPLPTPSPVPSASPSAVPSPAPSSSARNDQRGAGTAAGLGIPFFVGYLTMKRKKKRTK